MVAKEFTSYLMVQCQCTSERETSAPGLEPRDEAKRGDSYGIGSVGTF